MRILHALPRYAALMAYENPFFVKEVRALSRSRFAPVSGPLMLQSLLLFVPLLLLERILALDLDSEVARKAISLVLLGLLHAGGCAAAGWAMGRRVLIAEHRQGALESLRL